MEDKDIVELQEQIDKKKQEQQVQLFKSEKEVQTPQVVDKKQELVENMFEQAVVHQVANDKDLNQKVLSTAKTYTETKMETIKTKVETEKKEAVFDSNKDACESYGFNEKTTPTWAVACMRWGYNVMLAIYIAIASFTVMPIIFLMKKIQVAVKKTWIAIIMALVIYLAVTLVPILIGVLRH